MDVAGKTINLDTDNKFLASDRLRPGVVNMWEQGGLALAKRVGILWSLNALALVAGGINHMESLMLATRQASCTCLSPVW